MKIVASRIRASLAIASLVALPMATAFAEGAPPGIYSISVPAPPLGRPNVLYTGLSGDGSIVRSEFPNLVWTYPDGQGAFFPTGSPTLTPILDASPDMEVLLGNRNGVGRVVTNREGTSEWVLESAFPYTVNAGFVSPNGQFAAGNANYFGPSGLQRDAGRWNIDTGFQLLKSAPDLVATAVVGVTNDGTVYGHGYVYDGPVPAIPLLSSTLLDRAVRWNPDGRIESLGGIDDQGKAWKEMWIDDLTPDGAFHVGRGIRESAPADQTSFTERTFAAVFDHDGIAWTLWDGRVDKDSLSDPYRMGVTADGSLAFGHLLRFDPSQFGYVDAPLIWTPDGGRVEFEVFLRSMGLDTTNWKIGSIVDMSDDGRSFLVNATERNGGSPFGIQLLVVVPEPGSAALVGVGLVGLAFGRRRMRA
ncbi:MAG: PEP-CTERM sorting domain-containing protein [Myxococcota bacterium]